MIETPRLLLRPFREDDAADLYAYLHNPLVNCFAGMKVHSHTEALETIRQRIREDSLCYAIVLKSSGKVIGEIEAMPESSNPDATANTVQDTFSPCWMLHPDYHHQGYAYEAARAFFDHLFTRCGARRIYAYTEDYNVSSQRLCERLGMRREGIFMEFVSFVNNPDGTPLYENTIQYAILKKEWRG